jgi:hypothetical protein
MCDVNWGLEEFLNVVFAVFWGNLVQRSVTNVSNRSKIESFSKRCDASPIVAHVSVVLECIAY